MSAGKDFIFVQSTTEQGGAETVLLNMFSASEELKRRALVVILGFGRGDISERLRDLGTEVLDVDAGRLRYPLKVAAAVRRLVVVAHDRKVKVIAGNGAHPQVYAGLAAWFAGTRSAYFVHDIHRTPLLANHPIIVAAVSGRLDVCLANSRASQEAMRRLRPNVRHELVYPGTPIRPVGTGERASARAELGVRVDEVLFGVFGRLQWSKGQDVFIEAARHVASENAGARFVVVGGALFGLEPEFEIHLRTRSRDLGLDDRLVFTGHRPDVIRLMAACDVVCHTTRTSEAFGMVLIEAMAQGRAVVATRAGGPVEIVDDGATGLLVEPGNAAAFAQAMMSLGANPERRRAMGEAGLVQARARFSSEAMAARVLEALGTAL